MGKPIHYLPGQYPLAGDIISLPLIGGILIVRRSELVIKGRGRFRLFCDYAFPPRRLTITQATFSGVFNGEFTSNQFRKLMRHHKAVHIKKGSGERITIE